ncbi:phage tail protein, partial [Enterobacter sp. FL1277]|uniref:phage tail protein n=1 Tax=Enterobacter sp. FL1277 TaxID=2969211 RepID=UPI002148E8C8
DSNEKIAGMADDIKSHADELEKQAQEIQENADGLAQAAVKIDEISVSMDGMTGGVKNSAIAIIQNGLAQVVSRRSQTATNAGNSASIDRVDTTIADASQAVARALVTLDAEAGGNISNSTDLTETLADFTQASATKINTLTVKSGENSAAINVNAKAIADVNGDLSAMYNIKVSVDSNGRQYAAGMGIGVENTPEGMQSQVMFLADRFAVMTQAGGDVTLPFVIQNGQTIIRDTVIGEGTINNGKIGNYIQSSTWDGSGNVGWHINKSGYAVFNNVTVRGTVYATNGSFKGSVEATTFVGDIANVGIGSDVNISGGGVGSQTITFTDSSTSALGKSALLEALIFVSSLSGTTTVSITLNINGNTRDLGKINVPAGTGGLWMTVRHAVRGITSATVTGTITVIGTGTASKTISAPTLTITRGTGSFA